MKHMYSGNGIWGVIYIWRMYDCMNVSSMHLPNSISPEMQVISRPRNFLHQSTILYQRPALSLSNHPSDSIA